MRFFPGTYFPTAYFGQEADEGGQQFANTGAHLFGTGSCTAGIKAVARPGTGIISSGTLQGSIALVVSLAASLSGGGLLHGTLSGGQQQQPEPVRTSGGGSAASERKQERQPQVFAEMAATMGGQGRLAASPTLLLSASVTMEGRGTLRALPVVDITRLLQYREEEMMLALLLAVGF